MTIDLILGTAGHIDHGKTSLIRALTGVDTDRLPEEKRRGITIELGFAELEVGNFRLGIVDVPGHERFVRNMLAGATGMDLALLVVAADDSIKPQTLEHLEILRLLDLQAGVIAVTKCDLADPAWIDLVEEEIRELVGGTFLATAPIVRTSAQSGAGIELLRERLEEAAQRVAAARSRRLDAPFRMAIDRTFTIAGHGTVVTGSVSSGRTAVGDSLVIQPGNVRVRVRGLQNHDRPTDEVHAGQRAAINLVGVHHDETRRGQELASEGHLAPARLLSTRLTLLPAAPRPLKDRARVRLHLGTAEMLCAVRLLEGDRLVPGETALAQLFLSEPAVCTWNQPFVIRSESPVATIGGGVVLDPDALRIRAPQATDLKYLREIQSVDPQRRAAAACYLAGLRNWDPATLYRTAGVEDPDRVGQRLREQGTLLEVSVSPTRRLRVHRDVVEQLRGRMTRALEKLHDQNPLRTMHDRAKFRQGFRYAGDEAFLDAVLDGLRRDRLIRLSERGIGLSDRGPKLSQNEQKLLEQLVAWYREAGFETPTVKQMQQRATRNQEAVPQLVALAANDGELVEITPEYFLHRDTDRLQRELLASRLAHGNGLTLSEIREILNTTRKYAIPYCEYLDRQGFTHREGDVRTLAAGPVEATR